MREALRQTAKDRQRRVIFDNDGDDAAAFQKDQTPSIEKILARRTSFLNKYPVDTINYSITRGGFDYLTTRTEVGELAYADDIDPNTYNTCLIKKKQLVVLHKSADGNVTTLSSRLELKNGVWYLVFETTDF